VRDKKSAPKVVEKGAPTIRRRWGNTKEKEGGGGTRFHGISSLSEGHEMIKPIAAKQGLDTAADY